MPRRPIDGEPENLFALPDGTDGDSSVGQDHGADVEFGAKPRRSTDRRVVVVVVVALVVGAFFYGDRRGSGRSAAPSMTTPGRGSSSSVAASAPDAATTFATAAQGTSVTPATPAAPSLRSFDLDCPTTSPVDGGTGPASIPADCSRMACTQMPPTSDDRGGISCVVEPGTAADTTESRGRSGLLAPNTADLGLYAVDPGGDGRAVRIDLNDGIVTPVPDNSSGNGSVIAVDGAGGTARGLTSNDIAGTVVARRSDGTYWSLGLDNTSSIRPDYSSPELRHIAFRAGSPAEVLQEVDVSLLLSEVSVGDLLGTTADDRPVLRGPNGQGYIVDPATGTFQRLTTGRLVSAQHDAYSEVVCDGTARCELVLHSAAFAPVTLAGESQLATSFSPDGTHALLIPVAPSPLGVRSVDLTNGATTVIGAARGPIDFTNPPSTSPSAVWTPDGSTVMLIDGDHLLRIDIASNVATSFALPAPLDASWRLLTIA